jgi:predicted GNAT family acetyltransferase/glutaredoxin
VDANVPLIVTDDVLTLYGAEWCPFSSAVREVLTELGLDFVARQVEPWPSERHELQDLAGTDQIPVLVTEDGRFLIGTRQIFGELRERQSWKYAASHRKRFADHVDARMSDAPGQLIEYFRATDELEAAAGTPDDAEVVHNPDASRFELRLGGRLIGIAAYRRRNGRLALTHTEIQEEREGQGFGSALAAGVLEEAARQGLEVTPLCPFIAAYIEKHPEYEHLVPVGYGER